MVNRHERQEKRKHVRVPSGKISIRLLRKKTAKHVCAVCGKPMHGLPHGKRAYQVKKLSKSQRRPSALLAGVLCNNCRKSAVEEAVKVKYGAKKLTDVDFKIKKYSEKIMGKIQ